MSTQKGPKKSFHSNETDFYSLIQAIKDCLIKKKSAKSTAKAYSISRTTLQRYVTKVEEEYDDIRTVDDDRLLQFVRARSQRVPSNQIFSIAQEEELVVQIIKSAKHCNGLSIKELRELAFQFAEKLGVEIPDNWYVKKMAGVAWYMSFMRRHPKLCKRPVHLKLDKTQSKGCEET